ncbi:hypothetical protein HJFPF1_08608 [Paramyrothecium foliicola]|nr:hypothetical protein HJFPF1_08608 [Paramyrothecium foliicola]
MVRPRTVLVIGSNGYIGSAVCRAFVRAGWHTYGLIRRPQGAATFAAQEILPVVGSLADFSWLDGFLNTAGGSVDVIVGCVEPPDYAKYYTEALQVFRRIAQASAKHGVKPLVLWSSGCKDYGTGPVDGTPGLAPHTEESPLNGPDLIKPRTEYSLRVLEHHDFFDAAVLRPTNVYGYSSSYYGTLFTYAEKARVAGTQTLQLAGIDPRSIMHAMHVDDCGEAYVALAEYPERAQVHGQCFNISSGEYSTAGSVLQALGEEYGFPGGAEFIESTRAEDQPSFDVAINFGFSQWVGSDKIRKLTGWTDRRLPLTENLHVYRLAYEYAVASADEDVARMRERTRLWEK